MADASGQPIRIVLHAIQILDKKEAFYKRHGEFKFTARVSTPDGGGQEMVTEFPKEGVYYVSNEPGKNRFRIEKPIFQGTVEGNLTVEMTGLEHDKVSAHDELATYRREFTGAPDSWYGMYGPGNDHPESDPENMGDWRIWYRIEKG